MAASHDTSPPDRPAPDLDSAAVIATPQPDAPAGDAHHLEVVPIVDWARTARRLRRQLVVIGAIVVVSWLVVGLSRDALTVRLLAELAGVGVLVSVAAEFVVVGGAALRGVLRAGERGERLSGRDVSLLPPQVTCRRSRDC